MRGRHEHGEHAAHMKHHHHRKHGGKVHHGRHHKADGGEIMKAGGNPEVEREAEEKKHGGRAHHGRKHRKHGGHVVEGKHMKHRMDRPGRKKGGRVGADSAPLSSAHNVTSNAGREPKNQEGGMSA